MASHFFDKELIKARFIRRPNRFVVYVEIKGVEFGASLPNPGKLGELFVENATLLVYQMEKEDAKYQWRVAGVLSPQGKTIMLDTHVNNRVADYLLRNHLIPSLAHYDVVRWEVKHGNSRFDFLLTDGKEELYCEVKSCTLFHKELAMFPDAVTERGRRHVQELGELTSKGIKTVVLFIIQSDSLSYFLPDFHTDPAFSQTLFENRNNVQIVPISIGWNRRLNLLPQIKELTIPWHIYERHGVDSGFYLFLVEVIQDKNIAVGSKSREFKKGFYCYVGSAKKGLQKRIERHKRIRKNKHWHMDYLREEATVVQAWPIRIQADIECVIAQSIRSIADSEVPGFGSSDCHCCSHLFYFAQSPLRRLDFQETILHYRMSEIVQFS